MKIRYVDDQSWRVVTLYTNSHTKTKHLIDDIANHLHIDNKETITLWRDGKNPMMMPYGCTLLSQQINAKSTLTATIKGQSQPLQQPFKVSLDDQQIERCLGEQIQYKEQKLEQFEQQLDAITIDKVHSFIVPRKLNVAEFSRDCIANCLRLKHLLVHQNRNQWETGLFTECMLLMYL